MMISNNFMNFEGNEDDLLSRIVGCTPIRLEEAHLAEMRSLIKQLPIDLQKLTNEEKNLERFQKLVELYGDEPQLLDPLLPELVDSIVQLIHWPSPNESARLNPISTAALVRLRALSAVRGYKYLMRFLPHKLELLEPVLASLEYLANHSINTPSPVPPGPGPSALFIDKQIVHILVIWLMIICKNPFNLTRLQQSAESDESPPKSVADRIVNCLETLLNGMPACGGTSVVPILLAQILTRNPDNRAALAPRFEQFQRIFQQFQSELDGGQYLINQLALANSLLKLGRRHEIRPFANGLLHSLTPSFLRAQCPNILVRNLIAKCLQLIAIVLLRPKLAPWRYNCGYRSLEKNLRQGEEQKTAENVKFEEKRIEEEENGGEDDEDIPYDEVEMLLSELLLKIRDRDNLVRWTAAKGVARINARIPLEMAAEVVTAVLGDCFGNAHDKDTGEASAWMGGCLTLAELCRRGCLLPDQVPKVISTVLSRALVFEQPHQSFMLAVNVRDAACYICWAFSRAYEASLLCQHLRPLGGTLLSLALFDREVNVRRAASAAFQENVGRNDSFPHGIPILQIIDYMEVARIRHCYTELAVKIAHFPEYIRPMLDHLCTLKSRHWDEAIRELAAESLQLLAPFDSEYAYNELLPELCIRIQRKDPAERHGAFFAVSALLEALSTQHNVSIHRLQLLSAIVHASSTLSSHRAKGFSLTSKSMCRLIQALCTIGCELDNAQLANFHDILDLVVGDENPKMARWAIRAFPSLMAYYRGPRLSLLLQRIRTKYFPEIDQPSQTELIRCSCISPLGYLPPEFLTVPFDENGKAENNQVQVPTTLGQVIIRKLIGVILDLNTPKWVFARVAAAETICTLLLTSSFSPQLVDWPKLIGCLCQMADDYTTTTNGNIGRFARRSAIMALGQLLPYAFEQHHPSIGQAELNLAIGKIMERACESIDDLREKASTVLAHLANLGSQQHPLTAKIAELDFIRRVFVLSSTNGTIAHTTPRDDDHENGEKQNMNNDSNSVGEFNAVDWRQSKGFSRLASLLGSSTYGQNALAGFVLSAGSVCGWTRENAFLAIAGHLRSHKRDVQFLEQFLAQLLQIYDVILDRQSDPSPVLIVFQMLLNDGQLQCLERRPDSSVPFTQLCELVIKLVTGKCKSKVKLDAISVLGSLLQLDPASQLYRRLLRLLLSLLNSPYAALREKAAEQLFEAFSLADDDEEGKRIGEALELLSHTDWSAGNAKVELTEISAKIGKLLLVQPE